MSEQPGDPRRIIKELIKVLTGRQEEFDGIPAATMELRRVLAPYGIPLRCLLVIDDVWRSAELSPLRKEHLTVPVWLRRAIVKFCLFTRGKKRFQWMQ